MTVRGFFGTLCGGARQFAVGEMFRDEAVILFVAFGAFKFPKIMVSAKDSDDGAIPCFVIPVGW